MYLVVDGQALQTHGSRNRGVGRYAANLITALAAARPGWWIEIIQSGRLEPLDPGRVGGAHVRTFRPPLPADAVHREANERFYGDWLLAQGADALLVANFFEAQGLLPLFTGPRPPLFGILYDLIPLLFREHYLSHPEPRAQYAHRLRQLLDTDCLLAISGSSGRDLARLFDPPRPQVATIGGALDRDRVPLTEEDLALYRPLLREKFGLEREFLLYVGGFDPRKNLRGAMQAYAALPASTRRAFDFVIACDLDPGPRAYLEGIARDLGIADTLKLTGYVTDAELRTLYQTCRLFFFPSLYEGLGLPVLEALRCGAPVLASDRASIPEYAGPVSRLFEPEPPAAAAADILRALAEPRDRDLTRRQEFAAAFSWERCAALAASALETIRPARRPRRRRLAWVAPPADGLSGDFLALLARDYDLDVVLNPGKRPNRRLWKHCGLIMAGDLPRCHAACPYDLFVYDLRRGPVQPVVFDLLGRFRGLVVLPGDGRARVLLENPEFLAHTEAVIVSSPAAREGLRSPAVPMLVIPSAAVDTLDDTVRLYATVIDAAIARREASDALWCERAAEALASCKDAALAEDLIETWAALRHWPRRGAEPPLPSDRPRLFPDSTPREVA
jgi:glycosyltransferase involved in cell wall biosynthesis